MTKGRGVEEFRKAHDATVKLAAANEKIRSLEEQILTDAIVKHKILGLASEEVAVPQWTCKPPL